ALDLGVHARHRHRRAVDRRLHGAHPRPREHARPLMSKAKIGAIVVSVILVFYFVLMGQRAWILVREPAMIPKVMGIALFVLPVIGAWTLIVELIFGARTEKLARILGEEGGLPVDDLPRTPGGKIIREAADKEFVKYQAEAEAAPDDWRSWFRLSCAYDASGDRKRARATMRQAISMEKDTSSSSEEAA